MHYDVTLIKHASRPVARPLPPDIRELREHRGVGEARMMQLRRSLSAGLYRMAERIAPRPMRNERDELFEAISALLSEPKCEAPMLKTTSQGRC